MKNSIIIYYYTIISAVYMDFQLQINKLIEKQIIYDICLFLIMISIANCFLFVVINVEKI